MLWALPIDKILMTELLRKRKYEFLLLNESEEKNDKINFSDEIFEKSNKDKLEGTIKRLRKIKTKLDEETLCLEAINKIHDVLEEEEKFGVSNWTEIIKSWLSQVYCSCEVRDDANYYELVVAPGIKMRIREVYQDTAGWEIIGIDGEDQYERLTLLYFKLFPHCELPFNIWMAFLTDVLTCFGDPPHWPDFPVPIVSGEVLPSFFPRKKKSSILERYRMGAPPGWIKVEIESLDMDLPDFSKCRLISHLLTSIFRKCDMFDKDFIDDCEKINYYRGISVNAVDLKFPIIGRINYISAYMGHGLTLAECQTIYAEDKHRQKVDKSLDLTTAFNFKSTNLPRFFTHPKGQVLYFIKWLMLTWQEVEHFSYNTKFKAMLKNKTTAAKFLKKLQAWEDILSFLFLKDIAIIIRNYCRNNISISTLSDYGKCTVEEIN